MAGPLRILVVDDNPAIHKDFQKVLASTEGQSEVWRLEQDLFGSKSPANEAQRYSLTCAGSGPEALKLVMEAQHQGQPFAAVFVDMRMPGWDGLETVTQLLARQADLKVVISSAYMDYAWHEVLARLQRPGVRLLRKPWSSGDLMNVLQELLPRHRPPGAPATSRGRPGDNRRGGA